MDTRSYPWNRGHKTVWPNQEHHSQERRPIVYHGLATWWVDDSGLDPLSDRDDWDQHGFPTWREAIDYALRSVARAAQLESHSTSTHTNASTNPKGTS